MIVPTPGKLVLIMPYHDLGRGSRKSGIVLSSTASVTFSGKIRTTISYLANGRTGIAYDAETRERGKEWFVWIEPGGLDGEDGDEKRGGQ